ncbi:MAG: 3-phosphoshikimate 1-carboxyvinyltransferase [Gammaproteobacteria bacterium]|nr:3-phosphoshikimate 1-carboxyvinyltransferase [Gammaproteobacteria bacterium]
MKKEVIFKINPGGQFNGDTRVASDKSISHRSIILGSIAEGVTQVDGFLEAEDTLSTLKAFRHLGVRIEHHGQGRVEIQGVGMNGLSASSEPLDLGNSGTSMRLMSGLLSAQSFDSVLTGDESLSKRPMQRVTVPLAKMGAVLETTNSGTAPIRIQGNSHLNGIHYSMDIASAQVKSCLLLAGLYAQGTTSITEPAPTRDHTERMLEGFGYPVKREGSTVLIEGRQASLKAVNIDVPGDISSAAFFMVGASISPGSNVLLKHVGVNPTRTGIIDILRLMGSNIELLNQRTVGGEMVADIRIRYAPLQGVKIPEYLVPLAIDEFPVIFVAAACAEGQTVLTGAAELRVKESDRIQVMADGLQQLGIDANPTPDGMRITGSKLGGGVVDSGGDHRIAMAFSIAALKSTSRIEIRRCDNVQTSFPDFPEIAARLGLDIQRSQESV